MTRPHPRTSLVSLATILALAAGVVSCGLDAKKSSAASATPDQIVSSSATQSISQATSTPYVFGSLFDSRVFLRAGPVHLALQLYIPSLNVIAPVLGVGLTAHNTMDAPQGPVGDSVWHSAFWYRGGGIPGDVGTATIAAHVDDSLGDPEVFARLGELIVGDQIIIHNTISNLDITFTVNEVTVYSAQDSLDLAVLVRIYGAGPVVGDAAQPALDGLSHLTLITCAGNFVDGAFDHHTVVYATRNGDGQ